MKKFRLIAAMLIAAMLISTCALADVKATGDVNLRTGPGLAYEVITSVKKGKTLDYLRQTSIDDRGVAWYLVDYKGRACWISSVYSEVVGESVAPAAGPSIPDLSRIAYFTELSGYHLMELDTAAMMLDLPNYAQTNSEVPYEYYNENLKIAGYDRVEYIGLVGGEYKIFGVAIGMSRQQAAMNMNFNGLKLLGDYGDVMVFEHASGYGGYDSCINVEIENGVVTAMDWSTYTG